MILSMLHCGARYKICLLCQPNTMFDSHHLIISVLFCVLVFDSIPFRGIVHTDSDVTQINLKST